MMETRIHNIQVSSTKPREANSKVRTLAYAEKIPEPHLRTRTNSTTSHPHTEEMCTPYRTEYSCAPMHERQEHSSGETDQTGLKPRQSFNQSTHIARLKGYQVKTTVSKTPHKGRKKDQAKYEQLHTQSRGFTKKSSQLSGSYDEKSAFTVSLRLGEAQLRKFTISF